MFFKDKKKHLIQIKFIFGTQYIVCSLKKEDVSGRFFGQ